MTDDRIIHISTWASVNLHFLSLVYGLYLIMKRLFKWAWDPKMFFMMQLRDRPPQCLVDNNLGTHSYVKIKGVKFHYVEAGCEKKPLVLLLHGFPDCWLSWREQIPCLAEHFRVVAIDLKGFGDSDKPPSARFYKIEILIEELRQFILTLGVQRCNIIGHDLGGLLGWYMVALHEDMISNFVAISSTHPNLYWDRQSGDSVFNKRWMHFSRLPFLPEIDALKEDLSIINNTFQHLPKNPAYDENNYVEAYKYAFSRKEDWTGPINYYRNLPFTLLNSDTSEQIATRTMLIAGNMDPSVTVENMAQSTEYLEKCTVRVIPGAQHFPHQEKPDIVNKFILKFFLGALCNVEKPPSKGMVSSWFGSLSSTVKYGNHILDAVQKKSIRVGNVLPSKMLYLGQTN